MKKRNYITAPPIRAGGTMRDVAPVGLRPNRWNYNEEPEETFQKLVESIRSLGFSRPIVARQVAGEKLLEIVNGEHRWRAAEVLELKTVPVFDLGEIPDEKAKELCIVLNERPGRPDQIRLADLLRDLSTSMPIEKLGQVLPYSSKGIRHLVEAVDFQFAHLSLEGPTPAPAEQEQAEELVVPFGQTEGREVMARLAKVHADPSVALEVLLNAWELRS